MKNILEGSRAIALTIKNIKPQVVSAYPITPQTHIVEDLAKFKADGEADYEYARAESEFAAASIALGGSAAGVRVYTATSSQGLLLMAEVIYNIAGMRLPIVLTCANRALSAPISIWNDQQDVMAVRDTGWILLFAENHQEAVNQHIMAYKIAEQLNLPVMVNVDGFLLTHTYEPVEIPSAAQIKKYLPNRKPKKGSYLDPKNPITMGALATPAHYMEIREELHQDLVASQEIIQKEYESFNKFFKQLADSRSATINNSFLEYTGPKKPETIIVAMGSVIGTIKQTVKEIKNNKVGILKIKLFRPFPAEEIIKIISRAKNVAVIDKSVSLGQMGPLASDIKAAAQGLYNGQITSFIAGLGGRDITKDMIKKIISLSKDKNNSETIFIEK